MRRPLIAILSALIACGGGREMAPSAVSRSDLGTPEIAASPSLSFSPPDSLGGFSVEVGDAVQLADGRFAVADWGAQCIILFSGQGEFLRRLGRPGSGPNEYQAPVLVQRMSGDSLLIWDPYLRRASYLSTTTGLSQSTPIETSKYYGSAPIIGLLLDGRLVLRDERPPRPGGPQTARMLARIYVSDHAGQGGHEIASAPSTPIVGFRFFAPLLSTATDGVHIYVGDSATWDILVLSSDGQVIGHLRRAWTPREVTSADREAARRAFPSKNVTPALLADDRFDKSVPAFGRILPSPNGSIWVASYRAPSQFPGQCLGVQCEG